MMTELKYDPELPIWVSYSSGDRPVARFRKIEEANRYRDMMMSEGVVLDTTPKPKIPEDANYIFVEDNDQSVFAYRIVGPGGENLWIMAGNGAVTTEGLLEYIGDGDVTVMIEKEDA